MEQRVSQIRVSPVCSAHRAPESVSTLTTNSMSDKDVLISMGFDPARVECTFLGNDLAHVSSQRTA